MRLGKLLRPFRSFGRREDGILVLEMVLTLPIFLFCIIGAYTYWDAYRALNTTQKATYTVSDMISREKRPVSLAYLNGLHNVMEYIMGDRYPVQLRVTSITFSGVRNRFEVVWSRSPYNEMPVLTTSALQPLAQHIPQMSDGDSIVLVESNVQFTPAFAQTPEFFMHVDSQNFQQFIVTRPRFVPRICLEGVYCG